MARAMTANQRRESGGEFVNARFSARVSVVGTKHVRPSVQAADASSAVAHSPFGVRVPRAVCLCVVFRGASSGITIVRIGDLGSAFLGLAFGCGSGWSG